MINAIFSLLIITTITISLTLFMQIPKEILNTDYNHDIYIAIKDISSYTLASKLNITEDVLYYDDNQIFLDHNRVVKTPGYEILLYDIDELSFETENEAVYINLLRDNETYKFVINYQLNDL